MPIIKLFKALSARITLVASPSIQTFSIVKEVASLRAWTVAFVFAQKGLSDLKRLTKPLLGVLSSYEEHNL